jgi:hypothetical protein
VQPQKRKKKQSMETKATDSNAEISPHTTSSTIHEKLMSNPLGARCDETKLGHLETDDRPSEITHSRSNHRNADVAHDIFLSSLDLFLFFKKIKNKSSLDIFFVKVGALYSGGEVGE